MLKSIFIIIFLSVSFIKASDIDLELNSLYGKWRVIKFYCQMVCSEINLKEKNIDTRPVFPAISQYPYWPKKQVPQPVANELGVSGINLPSGVALSKEEIDYVCDNIIGILESKQTS